jgi:hypothetical protein
MAKEQRIRRATDERERRLDSCGRRRVRVSLGLNGGDYVTRVMRGKGVKSFRHEGFLAVKVEMTTFGLCSGEPRRGATDRPQLAVDLRLVDKTRDGSKKKNHWWRTLYAMSRSTQPEGLPPISGVAFNSAIHNSADPLSVRRHIQNAIHRWGSNFYLVKKPCFPKL